MSVPPEFVETGLLARFDSRVDRAVARVPRSLRPVMWVATAIGYPGVQTVPLVVVALLTSGPTRVASAVLAVSLALPRVLKHLIGRRRPQSEYVAAMRMAGPSFPSGHAYCAVAATGFYAFLAVTRASAPWPVLAVVATVVWILWVSLSRLFFRAHFASDVVGGWVIGATVLGTVLAVTQP